MSQQPSRPTHTLRDLFAVMAIIGVLLALILPAIQRAREASRRVNCGDNLKNIAWALHNYHDVHKVFPMGAMHAGMNPGGDPPVEARLGPSWYYGIEPFLEDRGHYSKIPLTQVAGGPERNGFCANDMIAAGVGLPHSGIRPESMHCPSSPLPMMETPTGPITLPTYVGIAGGCDVDPNSDDYRVNSSTAAGIVPPTTDNIYRNRFKGTGAAAGGIVTSSGMLPPCQHIKFQDCTDGSANTMIVAEQSDWLLDQDRSSSRKYHGDAGWTVGGTGPGGGWLSGTRRVDPVPKIDTPGGPPAIWGADCWNITTVRYPPNYKRVLGTTPLPGCSENHGMNNPLQSPHSNGVIVGMVDGSVQFISQPTDMAVWLRLAIRDDSLVRWSDAPP
jgi:prepilin-type processing-associated H-X9-DG protein